MLISRIEAADPTVDLALWLALYTFDTLSRIAFGEDVGFMANGADVDGTWEAGRSRFRHWHYWMSMPGLEWLIFKNPWTTKSVKPSALSALAVRKVGAAEIKERESKPTLLDKYLAAHRAHPDVIDRADVIGLTMSTIHAGADTTASTSAIAMSHLLRNPGVLERLLQELDDVSLSEPPTFAELNKLPYLEAVCKEALCVDTITADPLERLVPPEGLDIAGMWVPGGTIVSVSQHVTNRDVGVWGDDVDVFDPGGGWMARRNRGGLWRRIIWGSEEGRESVLDNILRGWR